MAKCKLEGCNKKVSGRRKFCCDKHRYRYHNIHNPRGFYAHLNPDKMTDDEYYYATTHPFSSEALGQD